MKTIATLSILSAITAALFTGCISAPQHASDVGSRPGDALTLGKVQKEIRVGMSGAYVVQALGSPNMVSTDAERREVWVYDKVATNTVHSTSSGWAFAVLAGGQSASGAVSKTQRTLTIIVKFDENSLVRDFAYHSSKF
ncbi:hypothetical protein OAF58_00775 [bacterium]|nr:hypothetical protein [bacterium]